MGPTRWAVWSCKMSNLNRYDVRFMEGDIMALGNHLDDDDDILGSDPFIWWAPPRGMQNPTPLLWAPCSWKCYMPIHIVGHFHDSMLSPYIDNGRWYHGAVDQLVFWNLNHSYCVSHHGSCGPHVYGNARSRGDDKECVCVLGSWDLAWIWIFHRKQYVIHPFFLWTT